MLGTRCRIIQSLSVVRNVRFCSQLGREFAWTAPPGGETGISIYNFHTRSKLPLILSNEGNLKWYVCGPTVYDEPHIGHACCYVRFDVIRRILTNIFGINVVYMMNITNIDDKIIEKAKKVGQTTEQLSSHYESRFHQNMHRLNVLKPTVVHRVTDNIQSVIHFIQKLVESGHAYVTDQGSVFFRCDSYSSYGNLSRMKVLPSEKAVDYDQKIKPQDFVLWKPRKPGEPFWDSPWGEGRPGWHIGCSVLASKVFGENIDIHSGGSDLIFPHHENELAQSNCYHHTNQWVNYWIHSGLLSKEGDNEKMSKSLGNIITIPDLLKKYTSNQFRMFCLLTPYAMVTEYSDQVMRKPVKILKKLAALRSMALLHIQGEGTSAMVNNEMLMQSLMSTQKVVRSALADNFDTQQMMSALMSLVHICNIELCKPSNKNEVKAREVYSIAAVTSYIDTLMSQLGVNHTSQHAEHADSAASSQSLEDIMNSVTHFREKVRNFSLGGNTANASVEEKSRIKNHRKSHSVLLDSSDQLRDELATLAGIIIKDTTDGKSHWHMIDKASGEVDTES